MFKVPVSRGSSKLRKRGALSSEAGDPFHTPCTAFFTAFPSQLCCVHSHPITIDWQVLKGYTGSCDLLSSLVTQWLYSLRVYGIARIDRSSPIYIMVVCVL